MSGKNRVLVGFQLIIVLIFGASSRLFAADSADI